MATVARRPLPLPPSRPAATTATSFYAIKRCRHLKSPAIFTSWEDCQHYISRMGDTHMDHHVEYSIFPTVSSAFEYIVDGIPRTARTPYQVATATFAAAPPRATTIGRPTPFQAPPAAFVAAAAAARRQMLPVATTTRATAAAASTAKPPPPPGVVAVAAATTRPSMSSLLNAATTTAQQSPTTKSAATSSRTSRTNNSKKRPRPAAPDSATTDPDTDTEDEDYTEEEEDADEQPSPAKQQQSKSLSMPSIQWNQKFETNLQKILEYKEKFGTTYIPMAVQRKDRMEYKSVGRWSQFVRDQCKLYRQDPKLTNYITAEKYQRLLDIDFKMESPMNNRPTFDQMYQQLVAYKEQHGHVDVPAKYPDPILRNWILSIRKEYIKYQNSKDTQSQAKITIEQIGKLSMLGFRLNKEFTKHTFEENATKWLEYKTRNGGKDPTRKQNNSINSFIRRMRADYKYGRLEQSKIDLLDSWGFVWTSQFKTPKKVEYKTWDQRYQQLLDFKSEHGHVKVKQKVPELGSWVHHQRMNYKLYLEGKQSPLNPTRVQKLKDVGFCFLMRERGPNKKKRRMIVVATEENNDVDDSDATEDDDDDEDVGDTGGGEAQQQQQPVENNSRRQTATTRRATATVRVGGNGNGSGYKDIRNLRQLQNHQDVDATTTTAALNLLVRGEQQQQQQQQQPYNATAATTGTSTAAAAAAASLLGYTATTNPWNIGGGFI